MFLKIGALKNLANITEKHLYWSLFSIKLQALLKRDPTQVFSCEICEIFKNTFLQNISSGCFCIALSQSVPEEGYKIRVNRTLQQILLEGMNSLKNDRLIDSD